MKSFFLVILLFVVALLPVWSQPAPPFVVRRLALPPELAFYDNQFSGLAISQGKLFLLSESRLQDKAEAKLYTVQLDDIDRQLADTAYALPYQKLPLVNLPVLRAKMEAAGQHYEGLEALVVDKQEVYLSVETDTPSPYCYLLKGKLGAKDVVLDTTFLVAVAKPVAADGTHIYNAGFEALAISHRHLLAFFEYNYFTGNNYVYEVNKAAPPQRRLFDRLPFRITDLTATGGRHYTGLNYFFKGDGSDAVYRPPATDLANNALIQGPSGYENYSRLIDLQVKKHHITWQPLWEFPKSYRGYNWEGLVIYKAGYLVINDKYTPSRPYHTTLLYLQRQK
jgi:hypothetical protein